METISLKLDEETVASLRRLAQARQVTLEALVTEMVGHLEGTPHSRVPFLGMMADEPEVMDEIVEEAMQARRDSSLRGDRG